MSTADVSCAGKARAALTLFFFFFRFSPNVAILLPTRDVV